MGLLLRKFRHRRASNVHHSSEVGHQAGSLTSYARPLHITWQLYRSFINIRMLNRPTGDIKLWKLCGYNTMLMQTWCFRCSWVDGRAYRANGCQASRDHPPQHALCYKPVQSSKKPRDYKEHGFRSSNDAAWKDWSWWQGDPSDAVSECRRIRICCDILLLWPIYVFPIFRSLILLDQLPWGTYPCAIAINACRWQAIVKWWNSQSQSFEISYKEEATAVHIILFIF